MPIYEYYCPHCQVRFSHLARRYDEPAPTCPQCGSREVQRLISAAHTLRSETERRAEFDAVAREVNKRGDMQDAARYLARAGSLLDEISPIEQKELFREMVKRRAEGAEEKDLQDLVEAIPLPPPPEGMETASPEHYLERYLSQGPVRHEEGESHHKDGGEPHENGGAHHHHHHHGEEAKQHPTSSPRKARDIGWG